jgi:hypothetical protein
MLPTLFVSGINKYTRVVFVILCPLFSSGGAAGMDGAGDAEYRLS